MKVGDIVRFTTNDDDNIPYGIVGEVIEANGFSILVKFYGMVKDWWVLDEELEVIED